MTPTEPEQDDTGEWPAPSPEPDDEPTHGPEVDDDPNPGLYP